jgi:hypothetical protein
MQYYWDNTTHINVLERFSTIWKGTLKSEKIDGNWIKPDQIRKLDDLFTDVAERNFYLYLDENHIYISLCQDSPYYFYEFEKDAIKLLKEIEKKFEVKIGEGEFFCWECKPMPNSYRYVIYKKDNKFKIKKTVLNWEKYDTKIKK